MPIRHIITVTVAAIRIAWPQPNCQTSPNLGGQMRSLTGYVRYARARGARRDYRDPAMRPSLARVYSTSVPW
jgi:hypothetical protein